MAAAVIGALIFILLDFASLASGGHHSSFAFVLNVLLLLVGFRLKSSSSE